MLGDWLRFESSPLWLLQDGSYHLRSRRQCPRVLCSEQDCKKYTKNDAWGSRCSDDVPWFFLTVVAFFFYHWLTARPGSRWQWRTSSHVLEKLLLRLPYEGGAVLQCLLAVVSLSEGFLPLSLQVILTSSHRINSLTCRSHHIPYLAWDLLSLWCMSKASLWSKPAHLPLPSDQPVNPPFL